MFATLGIIGGTGANFLYPISQDLGVPITAVTLFLSVQAIIMALASPITGKLYGKYRPGILIVFGSLLLSGSFVLISACIYTWQLYLCAVFGGIGGSLLYTMAVPTIISTWFKKKTAMAMGISFAFSGIGSVIANPIVGSLVDSLGWRPAMLYAAITSAVLTIPMALIFIKSPQQKGLSPYGASMVIAQSDTSDTKPAIELIGLTYKEALKTKSFYILFMAVFCFSIVGATNQLMGTFGRTDLGMNATQANLITSSMALTMIFSKIILGMLNDRIGVIPTSIIGCGITAAGVILFIISGTTGGTMPYIAGIVFGLGFSLFTIQPPVSTNKIFGVKEYGAIYGTIAIANTAGSSIFMLVFSALATTSGSFVINFYTTIGFCILSAVLYTVAIKTGENLNHKEV
jgi:MFS family permease